jgi:transcription-repair coupling factor (superfamily II helicase)
LIDDLEAIEQITHDIESQAIELRRQANANDTLTEDFPNPYVPWMELFDQLSYKRFLQLGPASVSPLPMGEGAGVKAMFTPNPRFGGRIKAVLDHVQVQLNRGDSCILLSRQSNRLQELWREQTSHHTFSSPPIFVQGALAEGFILAPPGENRIHLLTDGEIFGWGAPSPESVNKQSMTFQKRHMLTCKQAIGLFTSIMASEGFWGLSTV